LQYVGVDETLPPQVNKPGETKEETKEETFSTPKQLKQAFVTVPCKQRLVSLAAFIRWKALSVYAGEFESPNTIQNLLQNDCFLLEL
jgi:hypothetical protein